MRIVLVLVSLVLLAFAGYLLATRNDLPVGSSGAGQPAASTVMTEFQLERFLESLGVVDYEILVAESPEKVPPMAKIPVVSRRLIARCEVPEGKRGLWTREFQRACENWLESHQAVIRGQANASNSWTLTTDRSGDIEMPRRFYSVGKQQGVADMGTVVDHHGTAVISIQFFETN